LSLRNKILNLLADISDPKRRIEYARTIYYLYNVFLSGGANEAEIKRALYDIAYHVIDERNPLLDEETKKAKAKDFAEDIYKAFIAESLGRIIRRKYKFGL